jgi:hypothetical protein
LQYFFPLLFLSLSGAMWIIDRRCDGFDAMRSQEFWHYFDTHARPQLDVRGDTFAMMFDFLDHFDHPVWIVETGCVRHGGNWGGDGCSTILFDRYAEFHPGATVDTVDISEDATAACRSLVSARVNVHTGDSVRFLRSLCETPSEGRTIDLLYLDSFDLDWNNVAPSALHHMKELLAAYPLLRRETLVAVDDSPLQMLAFPTSAGLRSIGKPVIGGKGKFVAEYAGEIGADLYFSSYQCGWVYIR